MFEDESRAHTDSRTYAYADSHADTDSYADPGGTRAGSPAYVG